MDHIDYFTGKPHPGPRFDAQTKERCEHCGTELISRCSHCGAPVCCPTCCAEDAEANHG